VRGVALVVLATLALGAAPARAQSPIAGAGSFNDAPELAPGSYSDTLRGDETLFYAVRLKPGQQLDATATVEGRPHTSYSLALSIYDPLREQATGAGTQRQPYGESDRRAMLRVKGEVVGQGSAAPGDPGSAFDEPGIYYLSLAADNVGTEGSVDQFDTTLALAVTGTALPAVTPSPTPSPTPVATAAPEDDDGSSGALLAAIGLGLLAGTAAGYGGVRRRPRPG
jgi:Ca-activated chloride channel homolog